MMMMRRILVIQDILYTLIKFTLVLREDRGDEQDGGNIHSTRHAASTDETKLKFQTRLEPFLQPTDMAVICHARILQ